MLLKMIYICIKNKKYKKIATIKQKRVFVSLVSGLVYYEMAVCVEMVPDVKS